MTLRQFLDKHNIQLPKISAEQGEKMTEEITQEEVQWALKEAMNNTAPGMTGMTITMYRLFFMDIPMLLTAAVNQLAYVPHIGGCLKMRKIFYIQKIALRNLLLTIGH